MGFLLLARGSDCEPKRYAGAEGDLRLYGKPQRWLSDADFAITGIGEALAVGRSENLEAGALDLDPDELDAVLELMRRGRLEVEGPSRWPHAVIVGFDSDRARVLVVRGQFSSMPLLFHDDGPRLIIAPTGRAFRHFPVGKKLSMIEKGQVLIHAPGKGGLQLLDGRRDWGRDTIEGHNYEDDKAELKALFRAGVKEALDRGPYPMALSLSGGLDSAIVAQLCVELGQRLPAFNVSFEQKGDRVPLDLKRARLTAERLDLDLHEIVVTRSEVENLLRETIVRAGTRQRFVIDGLIYLTRLGQELEREGIASFLAGTGIDALLGSHRDVNGPESDEEFQSAFIGMFRSVYGLESTRLIQSSFAPRFIQPLVNPRIEAFCFRLPREYLVAGHGESFRGKKIARDAFASVFPPAVIGGGKSMPPTTTGSERLLKHSLGNASQRERYYAELYREHVEGTGSKPRSWYRRKMERLLKRK